MQYNSSIAKKIGVVYGILVILLVIAAAVRFISGKNLPPTKGEKSKITAKDAQKVTFPGKISLSAETTSYKVGQGIDLTVLFEAAGKTLDGADVVLRYDPTVIAAVGFSEGTSFKLYPRKDVDNAIGSIKITALDPTFNQPLTADKVVLGVVHFVAQEAGTTPVSFDYLKGATSKTTLTEQGTSQNILGEASGVTIKVEP